MTVESPTVHRGESRAGVLLRQVRERLGGGDLHLSGIMTDTGMTWTARWHREYADCSSGQRCIDAPSLPEALEAVLAWEDEADLADAAIK